MNRLLQALIALSGLAITGLLTWQGLENDRAQTRLALLSIFSEQVGVALATCKSETLIMASDAADELALREKEDEKYKDYLAQVTSAVDACSNTKAGTQQAQNVQPPPPLQSGGEQGPAAQPPSGGGTATTPARSAMRDMLASVTRNVDLRTQEQQQAPDQAASPATQRWYAVVASYALGEEATAAQHVGQLLAQARRTQPPVRVEVYRTRISKHYAIVLTGEGASRQGARELVGLARRNGWARDAFVQNDRSWVRCESPETAEGLRSCGGAARRS